FALAVPFEGSARRIPLAYRQSPEKSLTVQRTISGTVRDNLGATLPGATIVLVGTNTGTSADDSGNYNIVAAPTDSLEFNFLGFQSQRIRVGGAAGFDGGLEPEIE